MLHQHGQAEGFKIAHTVVVEQTGLDGCTHGGGNALAVKDGADGRRAAKVTGNDLLRIRVQLPHLACDVFVAGAMEAVLADAQFLPPMVGNTVGGSAVGNGGMEAGFKAGNLLHVGVSIPNILHGPQIDGIVGRGKRGNPLHFRQQGIIHRLCAGKITAMDSLVAHRIQIFQISEDTAFLQCVHTEGKARRMIRNMCFSCFFGTIPQLQFIGTLLCANGLDLAAGQNLLLFLRKPV